MLLTLSASCLKPLLVPGARSKKNAAKLELMDLPRFVREDLGLSGLNLSTDLLAGSDRARLESFRERADRASCSCLLLIESEAQPLAVEGAAGQAASQRVVRVVEAGHIIGCTAVAVRVASTDDDGALARVAARLKPAMERAEKLDLNLLISPTTGLTDRPERVTELLKKVGGFRIGTYPDFETASRAKDMATYLHRLTPYATVISASTVEFSAGGKARKDEPPGVSDFRAGIWTHKPYDLKLMVDAVRAVGYDGPAAIDYRGGGDVTMGVQMSRDALLAALGGGVEEPAEES